MGLTTRIRRDFDGEPGLCAVAAIQNGRRAARNCLVAFGTGNLSVVALPATIQYRPLASGTDSACRGRTYFRRGSADSRTKMRTDPEQADPDSPMQLALTRTDPSLATARLAKRKIGSALFGLGIGGALGSPGFSAESTGSSA